MKRSIYVIFSLIICLALLASGCAMQQDVEPEEDIVEYPENVISVGLYPYVPDIELFEQVLVEQWEEIEPDVDLEFVYYDCYYDTDPRGIDVFAYDALFTTYLAENGYIQPIPESSFEDVDTVLPFAMDAARYDGQLYGMPFLVCSSFLIHRADDAEIAAVDNFSELNEVLSRRMAADENKGLLANYAYGYLYYYVDAVVDFSGEDADPEEIIDLKEPDMIALESIENIKDMLIDENMDNDELGEFGRPALFNDGVGSAIYGYSEFLSFMDDIEKDLTLRNISFSDGEDVPVYYADVASMGSHVTSETKKANCIKLINLIGSEQFQQEVCFGSGDVQYMLPARQAVYTTAAESYPLYATLYDLVMNEQNIVMRFGTNCYTYLNEGYNTLIAYVEEIAD